MRAYALYGVSDLRYVERSCPDCPTGWAIVQVMAAGICSSDIPRIFEKGTYHFPTVPGHEFAGVVQEVGDKADSAWVGKHVGVFPLIPCHSCPQCAAGHYETCEHYDYIGSRRDGGFAEYVAVPVWNLIEVDDAVPFSMVAMLEPLSVALHAVGQLGDMSGKSVAVVGTGMIGLSVAYWARKHSAKQVWVIGRGEAKRSLAERIEGVEYCTTENGSLGLPHADSVIEAVGTPDAIGMAVTLANPFGKVVLMGNPSGDIMFPQDTYWRILRKQLSLCGTWNSRYDGRNPSDWTKAAKAISEDGGTLGGFITHRFPQEELPQALALMKEHKATYCKVMTMWNGCADY